jgi:hypothetical protein
MNTKSKPGPRCQELLAKAVAKTQGQFSAAGLALTAFNLRRAAGEDVIMFPLRGKWLVGLAAEMKTESDRVGALSRGNVATARVASKARNGRT